jgi:hypothetical protein
VSRTGARRAEVGGCRALFGCLEQTVWAISDPRRRAPACEVDLDVLLNDALARVPPNSSIRVEVWRAEEAG